MQSEYQHSLTCAAQEAPYLIQSLTDHNSATHPHILMAEIAKVPALLVEMDGNRVAMSPEELSEAAHFWTIDCAFFSHAEWLIREVRANASLSGLIASLSASELQLPAEPVLCSTSSMNPLVGKVMEKREVDFIRILPDQRRVDLRWAPSIKSTPKWRSLRLDSVSNQLRANALGHIHSLVASNDRQWNPTSIFVKAVPINVEGGTEYDAAIVNSILYLFGPDDLTGLLIEILDRLDRLEGDAEFFDALAAFSIITYAARRGESISVPKLLSAFEQQVGLRPSAAFPAGKMDEILHANPLRIFDARAWRRDKILG